jgi:hypothetical protein
MTRISRSAFVRGLGAAGAATAMPPVRAAAAAQAPRLQRLIDGYVRENPRLANLAIVAGVVRPDAPQGVLVFGGAPVAARDHARRITLDGNTTFLIGSNTKCFTSRIYAARQKDYGKTLGQCITAPLPQRLRDVPIVDLANYSSGFPTDNAPPIWWNETINATTLATLLQSLNAHPSVPACAPGANYSYSNFSWGLMGLAALGVSSPSQPVAEQWAQAVAELGGAIGLSPASRPWSPSTYNDLPAGYASGSLFPEDQDYGGPNWLTMGGGGNLASNGNDMLRWLRYNMGVLGLDLPLLIEQQQRTWTWTTKSPQAAGVTACVASSMRSPVTTSLGWFHASPPWNPAVRFLTKNGGVKGFSSWMGFGRWAGSGSPAKTGLFVLANAPRTADVIGARALRALLS